MKKFLMILFILCAYRVIFAQPDEFSTIKFEGPSGIEITADFYAADDSASAPLILLFHQFKSSRGEYREIAPVLKLMGFNCLAVDTRCGSTDRWNNIQNETAANTEDLGRNFLGAYPDLAAALNYAKENKISDKIILWGSSFSSTLIFKLATEYNENIVGLLSFSPGEYIQDNNGLVAKWAAEVKDISVFVTCGAGESENAKPIYNAVSVQDKEFYLPNNGNHGSSILLDDARNWQPVKKFLEKFLKN